MGYIDRGSHLEPLDEEALDALLVRKDGQMFHAWRQSAPPWSGPSNAPPHADDTVLLFGFAGSRSDAFAVCLGLETPRLAARILSVPGLREVEPLDPADFHRQVQTFLAHVLHAPALPLLD